jgi:hypothetical protein
MGEFNLAHRSVNCSIYILSTSRSNNSAMAARGARRRSHFPQVHRAAGALYHPRRRRTKKLAAGPPCAEGCLEGGGVGRRRWGEAGKAGLAGEMLAVVWQRVATSR